MQKQKIKGNGTSLWGSSKGIYEVDRIEGSFMDTSIYEDEPFEIWGDVSLFGPNTEWNHYTDSQIEKEVESNKAIRTEIHKLIKEAYPNHNIMVTGISWSEQGMQPDGGWNFDVTIKII